MKLQLLAAVEMAATHVALLLLQLHLLQVLGQVFLAAAAVAAMKELRLQMLQ